MGGGDARKEGIYQMVNIYGEYRTPRKLILAERVENSEQGGSYRLKVYDFTYYKSYAALAKAFNALVPDRCKIKGRE